MPSYTQLFARKQDHRGQKSNVGVFHIKRRMKEIEIKHFNLDEKGILWFKDRLVVLKDRELRNQILDEAHSLN